MNGLNVQYFQGLIRQTVTDPRAAAREIMASRLAMPVLWMALALTSVVSAMLLHISLQLLPAETQQLLVGVPGPLDSALLQAGTLLLGAVLAQRIGNWLGGRGTFAEALVLIVWLQTVLAIIQMLQIVALLTVPLASDLLGLVAFGLMFWILSAFVAEMHGFASQGKVLLGIIVALIVLVMLLSVVLVVFFGAGA
jgi:Yip1 domain